jgi:glycosyltransferase involved in cell wall biosynthesis
MNLKLQNILFIGRAMLQGGAENVILQLCEIFNPLVNKIVVCAGTGFDRGKLDKLNIRFYEIPDIESKNISTMLTISKTLRNVVRDENITVIHTHHRMAAFYVSVLGLYKQCTFINTSHNTFNNKIQLTRFAYKHAHLIACGEMVKKNLVDTFKMRDVTAIHNAVKEFDGPVVPDKILTALHDQGYFLIGNVGRLTEQKGFEYFIDAMPEILEKNPTTKFIIVGAGELEQSLKKRVARLHLEQDVVWLGFRNDVQNVMQQLDLVVLSSLWEGLPLTPIEAFSVGRTVIATAVDGTVEIIDDGVNGYLVSPRDSKKLAEKCCVLLAQPKLMNQFEMEAQKKFTKEFSYATFEQRLVQYYEGL